MNWLDIIRWSLTGVQVGLVIMQTWFVEEGVRFCRKSQARFHELTEALESLERDDLTSEEN